MLLIDVGRWRLYNEKKEKLKFIKRKKRHTQYFYDGKYSKLLLETINDYRNNKKKQNLPKLVVSPFGGNITKVG